jgi:CheY-specific phosphatase CheX
MKPQFFGQFLIEKGVLSKKMLIEILQEQRIKSPRFGEVAVKFGYLTQEQIFNIQKEQKKVDKFFGELSISMGYLTQKQIDEIIKIQNSNHVYLGQIVLEKNMISPTDLQIYLDEFHKKQKVTAGLERLIPPELESVGEIKTILDVSSKMFGRVADVRIKFDDGVIANSFDIKDLLIVITLRSDESFKFILNCSKDAELEIAQKMYNDTTICDDDSLRDCVGELGNTICGFLIAKLYEYGHDLKIDPPEAFYKHSVNKYYLSSHYKWAVLFPAVIPNGPVDIAIVKE